MITDCELCIHEEVCKFKDCDCAGCENEDEWHCSRCGEFSYFKCLYFKHYKGSEERNYG